MNKVCIPSNSLLSGIIDSRREHHVATCLSPLAGALFCPISFEREVYTNKTPEIDYVLRRMNASTHDLPPSSQEGSYYIPARASIEHPSRLFTQAYVRIESS